MNLLILGRGKTGSLVAEIARQRGHEVGVLGAAENPQGSALTREALRGVDVLVDFTTPHAVVDNIVACARAGTNMVVGTTGWYNELPRLRTEVEQSGIGFVWASNFSVGVNVFFEVVAAAASALNLGYSGQIVERHHTQKKDAPSGTAARMGKVLKEAAGKEVEITSIREGDTVGTHVLVLDSENDMIMLSHDAKSRRGFAEGAVRAAEWVKGRRGFFEFREIYRELA